jgi:hypothetical protein
MSTPGKIRLFRIQKRSSVPMRVALVIVEKNEMLFSLNMTKRT